MLIIKTLEIVSLLDENHSLAVVVSEHEIHKCANINVKRDCQKLQ